ncbi:hypothetical protein ANO11243_000690 [Dothideomycetidae sp. 11243]|nr:hypothetical protein ANO11243_000690 [fungal sp. No.11243]
MQSALTTTMRPGWSGLAAAKTYLELHPQNRMLVIEAESSCGGTWSADRLYPALKSNNMLGSYGYPDFPMSEARYGVRDGEHIPAAVVHRYLTDYSKRFGVFERTLFDTRVNKVEAMDEGGWQIIAGSNAVFPRQFHCRKLIVASGLTSEPNIPVFQGQEDFEGSLFHVKEFAKQTNTLPDCKSVVVIGGAKSAYDVAYAYADAGAQVHMVIRPGGRGPGWLCPGYVTPMRLKTEEVLHTRFFGFFNPCLWSREEKFGKIQEFLHGTTIGRWLVRLFWFLLCFDVINAYQYDKHEETKKLKPWYSAFWSASGIGIVNYDSDVNAMVRGGKIALHIANIAGLGKRNVQLSTGETFAADAIVCATGWTTTRSLNSIDYSIKTLHTAEAVESMVADADREILTRFPELRNQPRTLPADLARGGARPLYRFMVPPARITEKNIAFIGAVTTVGTSICAAVQALWICACFDDNLVRCPITQDAAMQDAILSSRWGRWRYPCGYGPTVPDLGFDTVPYFDLLLRDLGLEARRKCSFWNELWEPYKPRNFASMVDEYQQRHRD